ncbi:MAG: Ig-like domain-containing protein, partial [Patescibacteria group bacterium]
GTTSADAGGEFSLPTNLVAGTNSLKLTAKDTAGNISDFSTVQAINYETTAPLISNIEVFPNPAKAGTVTITFEVSETLEADPIAQVNNNTAELILRYQVSGSWRYTYSYNVTPADHQGPATISIEATDLANNLTSYQSFGLLTIDLNAPDAPAVGSLPAFTNVGTRTVSGTAEPGSIIRIYRNDVLVAETTSEADGSFSTVIDLLIGSNQIKITSEDISGNLGQGSDPQTIIYDITLPAVSSVEVNPTIAKAGAVTISFAVSETLESDPIVKVNQETATFSRRFSDQAGWGYEYVFNVTPADPQGPATITIEVTDLAQNTFVDSLTGSLTVDTIAPAVSSVEVSPSPAKTGPVTISFTVSETLEANPTIEVNNNTAELILRYQIVGTENSFSGSWRYTYVYNVTPSDQQGPATIYIEAKDLADNLTNYQTNQLTIDTLTPAVSNLDINPQYAKLGSKVTVDFSLSEALPADPLVLVGGKAATKDGQTNYSSSRIDYSYSYVISAADPDGTTPVSIEVTDLAGNTFVDSFNNSLIVDKASPEVGNFSVTPNPASTPSVSGQVSIKFNVGEPLKEKPKVYVTQNGAAPRLATVSGSYEAKDDVIAGYDGPVLITIEATDLAGNLFVHSLPDSLTADATKPVFSGLNCEITGNPGFEKYARENSTATITFTASEPLKFNPQVRINGNPATYNSQLTTYNQTEYQYKYTVAGSEQNGNAAITISGFDFANNEGTAETNSAAESFVIDLQNPTVAIAAPNTPGAYISYPEGFATNANPDGTDRPRSTTFYYSLAELSKVTVKVHKVGDSQVSYVKEDFNAGNQVATLIDNVWQNAGGEAIVWDGAGNVGPGKYAFIVEGRDRAGNLTLKKWGGTVWIQDNVLTLAEPDQQSGENNNPDPKYISP